MDLIDNGGQEQKSTKKKTDPSLIKDAADNLNNNNFKTTVDEKAYDVKNVKKFSVKKTTSNIGERRHLNCILI